MGIDKETKPDFVSIVLDDNKKYLDLLRERADCDGHNDETMLEGASKKIILSSEDHSFNIEEYYFEEHDGRNSIIISGMMVSSKGESYVYLSIPLSDIVLTDILQHSIKKLNKLKLAMETLK